MKLSAFLVPILVCLPVWATLDIGFRDDSDLTNFVTRPDIKAPVFDVEIHDPKSVETGYWFIAPYADIIQQSHARNYYQPCQTGPHIYDQNGDLIWSGACMVRNQNTCDFRVFAYNNSNFMSAILYSYGNDTKGHGIIMDDSYSIVNTIYAPPAVNVFNMHELNVVDGGSHALHFIGRPQYVDATDLAIDTEAGWITNIGFREVDLASGTTLFEWWAHDQIGLAESRVAVEGLKSGGWNWFHANSVDKNADGDYILSARFTDCIYKISGKDGSILWRLGGTRSSFVLEGFNFSRQHDARWLEYSEEEEVISFLDNAADSFNQTSFLSSALIIQLDKRSHPMTARVLQRWTRPDNKLSRLRGNFQILPNGNVFIGWSDNAYISEHSADGRLLMEAKFQSKRFVTYRAYKFKFTGNPIERPELKAAVYGTSPATCTTVCHVSWNGATEVAAWNFYHSFNSTSEPVLVGVKVRTGFETVFQSEGYGPSIFAEALRADGSVLGRSLPYTVSPPSDWEKASDNPCSTKKLQECQKYVDRCISDDNEGNNSAMGGNKSEL